MILKRLLIGLALILFPVFLLANPVAYAQGTSCKKSFFGIPVWYKYLETDENCNIQTGGADNVPALVILGFIDIALFLAGFLAVVMIIWGGYLFLLSNGDPGKIANGRNTILNAVIGLIIAILASQIVKFIARTLSS